MGGSEEGLVASYSFDTDSAPHIADDATGQYPLIMGGCAPCADDYKGYAFDGKQSVGRVCLPSAKDKDAEYYQGNLVFGGAHCYNSTTSSMPDAYPSRVLSGAPVVGILQNLSVPSGEKADLMLYGMRREGGEALRFSVRLLGGRHTQYGGNNHHATLSYSDETGAVVVLFNGSNELTSSAADTHTLPASVRSLQFQSFGGAGGSHYLSFEYWANDGTLASNTVPVQIHLVCALGETMNQATSQCEQCSDVGGGCEACSQELYAKSIGKFGCEKCQLGKYRETNTHGDVCVCGSCNACAVGYFADEVGLVQCKACPRGYYQRNDEGSSCLEVLAGYEALERGTSVPTLCAGGKYWDERVASARVEGDVQSSCVDCAVGQYQNEPGQRDCNKCKSDEWLNSTDLAHATCRSCPETGAICNGTSLTYTGGVWHEPTELPGCPVLAGQRSNTASCEELRVYHCVTSGCPSEGQTVMQCKKGYEGMLCAVCSSGYSKKLRECKECNSRDLLGASLLLMGLLLAAMLLLAVAWRHHHLLESLNVFAYIKILVSFVTVASTLDTQFDVPWPPALVEAYEALGVLCMDLGRFSRLFCLVDLSFFGSLCAQVLLFLVILLAILVHYKLLLHRSEDESEHAHLQSRHAAVAVYFLIFSYPQMAKSLVHAFECHDVYGIAYLREDYRIQCYTGKWIEVALFAGFFIATYVIGFPLWMHHLLYGYATEQQDARDGEELLVEAPPRLLGFLLHDYRCETSTTVCCWEIVEITRRLVLSVVGAFFIDKSAVCICVAFLLALFFFTLHLLYLPYRNATLNRLQFVNLLVLLLLYFGGLLFKVQAVEGQEKEDLGALLLLLGCFAILVVLITLVYTFVVGRRQLKAVLHAFAIQFEGHILAQEGVACVASFPGKFELLWQECVRQGNADDLSVACVFLPNHTPKFGQHAIDPDTGRCYCYSVYGEQKVWGCLWFEVWCGLVRKAYYQYHQRIRVFFFPDQKGQGMVDWCDCAKASVLRDGVLRNWPKDEAGWPKSLPPDEEAKYLASLSPQHRHCVVGLGGSQKAEVAWLAKEGIPFEQCDVMDFAKEQVDGSSSLQNFYTNRMHADTASDGHPHPHLHAGDSYMREPTCRRLNCSTSSLSPASSRGSRKPSGQKASNASPRLKPRTCSNSPMDLLESDERHNSRGASSKGVRRKTRRTTSSKASLSNEARQQASPALSGVKEAEQDEAAHAAWRGGKLGGAATASTTDNPLVHRVSLKQQEI
jgi:hypothetical protein